jgi:hypothetical protein
MTPHDLDPAGGRRRLGGAETRKRFCSCAAAATRWRDDPEDDGERAASPGRGAAARLAADDVTILMTSAADRGPAPAPRARGDQEASDESN